MRPSVGTLRLLLAGALGAATALLVACGSGGANLIPVANAGPLQNDFNAIANAVANGNCAEATRALAQAHRDAAALPSTADPRLRDRINQGLADLDSQAPSECARNSTATQTTTAPTTTTQTTATQTTTTTAPTTSTTTPTTTTTTAPPPTSTTTTPVPDNGGGTPGPTSTGAGAGAGGVGSGGSG